MEINETRMTIALIIDFDNFNSESYLEILLRELNEMGDVVIKKAYYSNFVDKQMKEKFIRYGIVPVMQVAYSERKNATDIRIAIEAMEMLDRDYINCFCIATNDLDFAPLVARLKEENKYIIGAGNHTTKDSYKQLCNRFINVDEIAESLKPRPKDNKKYKVLVQEVSEIIDSVANEEHFALFSDVMNLLYKKHPDFNPKNYGVPFSKPLVFFSKELSPYFELKNSGTIYSVKNKKKK